VEEVAVVLREPDDRRPRARLEVGQRRKLLVLALLEVGIDRPAVRAAVRVAERSSIRSTMSSVNVSPSRSACTCASAAV
jgi:hypothetical protein